MNETEQPLDRLLKPWTAVGLLILKQKAQYVQVEVAFLALDAQEVAHAITANFEAVARQRWDKRALAPGITEEELYPLWQAHNREVAVARNDLTLAAAILARRAWASPLRVTGGCLDLYIQHYILRGGIAQGDSTQTKFLFVADGPSPTVYVASDALAAVTRYVGAEFLSVLVSEHELRLRIKDATDRLEQGKSPAPNSLTNMEDWFSHRKQKISDEYTGDDYDE